MAAPWRFFLVVAHLVCPLLFFTDLTRNPYVSQIVLLGMALSLAAVAYVLRSVIAREPLRLAATPLDVPWLVTLAVCALSWGLAYARHSEFFRPSIISEGRATVSFSLFMPFFRFI